jgi:hypothetical protein
VALKGCSRAALDWGEFFNKKWLQIKEEIAYKEFINNTKTLELEILGRFLYNIKCKWGK